MSASKWDQRIQPAKALATANPFATDALRFYERITTFQKSFYAEIEATLGRQREKRAPGSLRDELDLFILLPKFRDFLSYVETISPDSLARSASALKSRGPVGWQELLASNWGNAADFQSGSQQAEDLLAWLFLQAYAEFLADHTEPASFHGISFVCPLCAAKPQVGVLRQEGDGARRSLVCALCSTEWNFRRILCPACGEENVEKLAIYTANQFTHVRIEGCDTCRRYIKTVDLTKNGLSVPVVDELTSIPLSLWAEEKGYTKVRANSLGV
jgi:FdhE protein